MYETIGGQPKREYRRGTMVRSVFACVLNVVLSSAVLLGCGGQSPSTEDAPVQITSQTCPSTCGNYGCYVDRGNVVCHTNCGGCLGVPGSSPPPYQDWCAPGKTCTQPTCTEGDLHWTCK